MSEGHEPTLSDVLAAVQALGERVDSQGRKQDDLRIVLMDRMDRLQDSITEQCDDVSALLDPLVTNQKIAERGLSEARLGVDRQSAMTTTMATFQRQLRRLQDEVRELRERP
jgi:hypothetical protein